MVGELPLARDGHSCTVIGHCMYLFGGYEEESMAFSNTVYSLNLITYSWTKCKSKVCMMYVSNISSISNSVSSSSIRK